MEIKEVIEILESHNKWRRGYENVEPTNPKLLGIAIDKAVEELQSCNVVTHENPIKYINNKCNGELSNVGRSVFVEIKDRDIATIEALHDILVDVNGYSLDFITLKRARELTAKMYKAFN